jgi:CO/xanthine dehydrogenase Mo-binding subunit
MGRKLQFATSFVADPGVARGSSPPYAARATRVEFEDVRLPVKTGPWRGLGAAASNWAVETAVDALARAKGMDPLRFRLGAVAAGHDRLKAVLRAVAAMSGWEDGPSGGGEARLGVACGIYKNMTYAAVVARVTRDGGRYKVARLWCAHDCGLVINPDQLRAQIEGNLVWGIGMALGEELVVEDGRIAAESFFDYSIPVFSDVPEIEISLLEGSPIPTGAGEAAIVSGTAAITSAIAALTGKTVTRLPVGAA